MPAQTFIWLLIASLGVFDGVTLFAQGISVELTSRLMPAGIILFMLAAAKVFRWRQKPEAARFAMAAAQLVTFGIVAPLATYSVVAASPFALVDPTFIHADELLGFDWLKWYFWVDNHPNTRSILKVAYDSMAPQAIVLCALFAYLDPRRVDELIVAGTLSLILLLPILYLLPSVGAFAPHGIPGGGPRWENDILALRAHAMPVIGKTLGIVAFPSYHTVLGVLYILMARSPFKLFIPVLGLNLLLIASVMYMGGHYFVDVIAGLVLACGTLGATQVLLGQCSDHGRAKPRGFAWA